MKDLPQKLKAARNRQRSDYFNGFIHAYCDNADCTARRFNLQIKTYGAPDPVEVRCPLCGELALPDRLLENCVETLG